MTKNDKESLPVNPTWYKDAIIYEVHVRAFYDSVTDGIGDFEGLSQKLEYLQDLGVTAIWMLPFCPSPMRDDGYDISDYTNVHPAYGTLRDFQRFLREAHNRGIRVITELVLNHTSDQHAWFQRSRRAAPGSRWRNFYVWSDTPDRYSEARIIFKDFESSNWTWDPVAKAYYWHRFYSHQPDLNWDNPEVRQEMFSAVDFWFEMGVDGLRLDAVPYLFESDGTTCENLPETHSALRELRAHVDAKFHDRMLLAEANQWPEDAAAYFGAGDECHMAFHFPVMPRLFMSLRMEDRYPIMDILKLTPPIPESTQWALFLRNHDELTLEMVTDEERDYMYRSYAQDSQMRINLGIRRRLAPLLENDRRKIELMNALLFSLPGTPVLYYGDEIGMGDNVFLGDRNGVRTPMQWSPDRNAGFSRANPQRLYLPVNIDPEYHYEAVNVETQSNNPHSLLWWMKRLIAQRKRFRAFGRGSMEFLHPANRRVLAFLREYDGERLLVVANLSRFTQCVELDLSNAQGAVPVEVFGRAKFPPITDHPYFLSLGPHAFYWFHLEPPIASQETLAEHNTVESLPVWPIESWSDVFSKGLRSQLMRRLPGALPGRRWFLGKNRTIRHTEIAEIVPLQGTSAYIIFMQVYYSDGDPDMYLLTLSVARGEAAELILRDHIDSVVAHLEAMDEERGVLYAGITDRKFSDAILSAIVRRRRFRTEEGEIVGAHTRAFRKAWSAERTSLEPSLRHVDQSNSLITFGDRFLLKLFRKLEPGIQPDRELGEFLTDKTSFRNAPRNLGSLEYRRGEREPMTVAILNEYVRGGVDGWTYTRDQLGLFFERALSLRADDSRVQQIRCANPVLLMNEPVPQVLPELLSDYLGAVRTLGKRTAEMHLALASRPDIPAFAPEPFTDFYRQGVYHRMLGEVTRAMESIRLRLLRLQPETQDRARQLLSCEQEAYRILLPLRDRRIAAWRIRHHGDYHLGQLLYTGNDFYVLDFEGDTSRPLSERRIKRSPLRDVASMIRSFDYVSHAVLFGQVPGITPTQASIAELERWACIWHSWVSAMFLNSYWETARTGDFLPQSTEDLRDLVQAYLLERAAQEIEYEIDNRPEWARIPIHGFLDMLRSDEH